MSRTDKLDRIYIPIESVDFPDSTFTSLVLKRDLPTSPCCSHCHVFQWLPLVNTLVLVLLVAGVVIFHATGGSICTARCETSTHHDNTGGIFAGLKDTPEEEVDIFWHPLKNNTQPVSPAETRVPSNSGEARNYTDTVPEVKVDATASVPDVMSSKSKSVSKEEEDELSRGGTDLSLFTKSAASLTYTTKSDTDGAREGRADRSKAKKGRGRNPINRRTKPKEVVKDKSPSWSLKYTCNDEAWGVGQRCGIRDPNNPDKRSFISELHVDDSQGLTKLTCCYLEVLYKEGR